MCIWGEAANLRFMPSMLDFIFELARAHSSGEPEPRAPENAFLETIVKPVYTEVAKEANDNTNKDYFNFRNYDDFSRSAKRLEPWTPKSVLNWSYGRALAWADEAFWSMRSISALRTKSGIQGSHGTMGARMRTEAGNDGIMDAAPGNRYKMLQDADWKSWFSRDGHGHAVPKRHRENVWWSSVFVANRRIFLLHAIAFSALVLVARRHRLNQRGPRLRVMPVAFAVAHSSDVAVPRAQAIQMETSSAPQQTVCPFTAADTCSTARRSCTSISPPHRCF
jgi:hypothetical protein